MVEPYKCDIYKSLSQVSLQKKRCQQCQYHIKWSHEGWCYMFQDVFVGCQQFLQVVHPPYSSEPLI